MGVPDAVFGRVVQFTGESRKPGTGFLLRQRDKQVLVTARHLCIDEPEEVLKIRHPWTNGGFAYQVTLSRVGMNAVPTADFAIFAMGSNPVEVRGDVPLNSDLFAYGQDAFILGYPHDIGLRPRETVQNIPFVKRCILSAWETDDDRVATFYIDAIVNPGFSGGPLAFQTDTGQWRFAGVVVRNMTAPLWEPTPGEPPPPIGPAGIGHVIDASTINRALP
jgi:Trypsin-like peptidase domain